MSPRVAKARTNARPSIRDVARQAGVSPGCVSNVINGRRRQDDEIGLAVLAAVKDLGYQRNTMASNLRSSESRIIGLVMPNFDNPFFADLFAKLERCAEANGYRIVAASSRDDPETELREVNELLGWRVAGMLVIPAQASQLAGHSFDTNTPMVVVDRILEAVTQDTVAVDNADASARVMRNILELGHRRVLVAYSRDSVKNMSERLEGVHTAIREFGADAAVDCLATGGSATEAREALTRYMEANPVPDAVFCLFNPATLAAYGVLQQRGLEPGSGTALVGFDDSAWMEHVYPPISAIVQPNQAMAEAAWDRLRARISGDDSAPQTIRVPCTFVSRASLTPTTHGPPI